MYRRNSLRTDNETRHQREGGNGDRDVAGKAGLIEKLLIERRLQRAPGIPHDMLQALILLEGQHIADLLVLLPSHADVFLVKQSFVRVAFERKAFRNDPEIDLAAI